MPKLIFLLKRKKGISKEQFREHYENSHVKLAQKYIGHLLVGYHRNYPLLATFDPSNQPAGQPVKAVDFEFDCITEMRVRTEADLLEISRIFNDPKIQPILKEDELKFLDDKNTMMIVCDEVHTGVKIPA